MSIFSKIRELHPTIEPVVIEDEQGNILSAFEIVDHSYESNLQVLQKAYNDKNELVIKFDEDDQQFELQLQALDIALSKAESDEDVKCKKQALIEKRDKNESSFISKSQKFNKGIEKASVSVVEAAQRFEEEAAILIASASEEKQGIVKGIMDQFHKGELEVDNEREAIIKALQEAELIKGGEGSRGGQILGRTKSGKAIYYNRHPENFHKKDHEDAAEIHKELGDKQAEKGDHKKAEYHYLAAGDHRNNAKFSKGEESTLIKAQSDYSAVIIRDYDNNVLMLQRNDESKQWMLPGGHIDSGEVPLQAAVRELKEETNLQIPEHLMWPCKVFDIQNGRKVTVFMASKMDNISQSPEANIDSQNEAIQFKWMSKSEWLSADCFKDTKEHMQAILCPSPIAAQSV